MSYRRQEILTQEHAADSKCKLNISLFLTLPPLLDCLTCTRNSVSIVLLLWMVGDGINGGGWFMAGCGCGDRGWVLSHSLFFSGPFVFCCLMPCLFFKSVEHNSYCVCFFVYYLFSLSQVPLTRSSWGIEIAVPVM